MDAINGRSVASRESGALQRIKPIDKVEVQNIQPPVAASGRSDEQLSSLAKKLSAAAELAAERDSRLSRKELADLAARIMDRIGGLTYSLAKDFYDSQLPDTQDEEWLERARKANDFARGKGENPFKGLPREQLSLIVHDESGAFTVSERRAALMEKTDQHNQWAHAIIDKTNAEYKQTGRTDQGLREILDFYSSLPPIEVAEYGNYEANIMMQLSQQEVEWPEFNTSLVDLVAKQWKSEEKPIAMHYDAAAGGLGEEGEKG